MTNRTAFVTGASRGIGLACARALADAGCRVVLAARDAAKLEAASAEIPNSSWVEIDLGSPASIEAAFAKAGKIDILVNNAGIIKDDLFVRLEPEAWESVIRTNLGGTYNFCRAVAYTFMKQRRGRIINLSSVAADHVNLGQCNYAASKGAINSLTRALAVELASRNVTVNAIAPGFIETDMSAAVRNKAGDLIKKMIPMRRLGQPEDVARVAVFLAGPDSAYLTGQVLTVDGGLSLGAVSG